MPETLTPRRDDRFLEHARHPEDPAIRPDGEHTIETDDLVDRDDVDESRNADDRAERKRWMTRERRKRRRVNRDIAPIVRVPCPVLDALQTGDDGGRPRLLDGQRVRRRPPIRAS